jgi:hypothetical protein
VAFKLAAHIDLNRAPETEEERYTVRQLKGALNQLGYYKPDPATGMTDEIDQGFKESVYAYQRKSTIFYDDVDLGPGSTTERLLDDDLDYMERDYMFTGTYIWKTVGDEKVRGSHAVRNGQTFRWAEPPEGGHPSEDYNCRCWAEHTNPPWHPLIDWVNEQRENREVLKTPYVQANAGALLFEGAVISVEMCLANGRCRAWLMQQAAKIILQSTYHQPPKELPAFPDAKPAKRKGEKGSRKRWVDSKGKIYEWDGLHGEVEVYDKTGKKHLGGFDPETGKQRSKPVKGRKIEK